MENQVSIDNKDRKIIEKLRSNPRVTQEEIGKAIGLSRPAIQKRIKALQDKGVIRHAVLVNEQLLGKKITAFILVILDRAGRVWNFTYDELLDRMDEFEILDYA